MSNLVNLYFHIDIEVNDAVLHESKAYFEEIVKYYASRLFRQDVEVHVYTSDGSLKSKMVMLGAIYIAIGQYGSFRAGIDQIIEDSKTLQKIVTSTLYKDGISEDLILESKRPIATPNKIRRLFLRIDRLESNYHKLDEEEKIKEIENIRKYIANLMGEMAIPEDIEMLAANISEKYIPDPNRFPKARHIHMPYINRKDDYSLFFSPRKLQHKDGRHRE